MFYFSIIAHLCDKFIGTKVVKEKLIVIKDLGVQIESHTIGGGSSRKFIDISRVRDIVINEVKFRLTTKF